MRKIVLTLGILTLFGTAACSSKKDKYQPPTRVDMKPGEWDHDKIRDVREAERAQTPAKPYSDDEDTNCVLMTASQMKRSKAAGCRKMDPREGRGDSYCCPRE